MNKKIDSNCNRVAKEYNDFCIFCMTPNHIGKDVWIGYHTLIDSSGGLEIGDHVTISSGVHIYSHDSVRKTLGGLAKDHVNWSHIDRSPVKIKNNVFIGANSIVLKGVTIGEYSVVGAGTIVNKDIPAYSLAIGNPMKIIKDKFRNYNKNE